MKGIPVLMYHALEDEAHPAGARDAGEQLYVLHVKQFREQMEYLQREGYRTFLLEELHSLDVWPDKTIVLTFDDGHESNYTLALPVLQEFGFKAHFFITTGWIGTPHYLNEEQIIGLRRAGMGVGSHGVTHSFLTDLSSEKTTFELSVSMKELKRITGYPIQSLSFPGGRMAKQIHIQAQQTGFRHICSSEPYMCTKISNNVAIPRFAINERMTLQVFSSLLRDGEPFPKLVRYRVLVLMKRLLGNRLYEHLRALMLRSSSHILSQKASDER